MDVPGFSLFQGAESIQVNVSGQQRIEEEVALEDRLRRNEELKNELQNAFDDLDDDFDEEARQRTIDSSAFESCLPNGNKKDLQSNEPYKNRILYDIAENNQKVDLINELKRLKNELASRTEELKNVSQQRSRECNEYEAKLDEMKKRLAVADAEKERAHMNRQQTHELFVESKQRLSEREERITELNAKTKSLETHQLELMTELEHSKTMISDLQHKYTMVERNANVSSEKHTDFIVKQINDRHAAQKEMMQQQINTMRTKLEESEKELKRLMVQNNELHQSREAMLVDKSDTINQLTRRLEESQRQCQNMIMSNSTDSDFMQENNRLKRSITTLEQRSDELQRTINGLTSRLEKANNEIKNMTETIARALDTSATENKFFTDTFYSKNSKPNVDNRLMTLEDRLVQLNEELSRILREFKKNGQEVASLKKQSSQNEKQIQQLKTDENCTLVELSTSREHIDRLSNKLKLAERELQELRKDKFNSKTDEDYSNGEAADQIDTLKRENRNFRQNCDHLNATIKELEDERDKIEEKYRDACKDIAEIQQKLGRLETQQCVDCENLKTRLKNTQDDLNKVKELYIQLSDDKRKQKDNSKRDNFQNSLENDRNNFDGQNESEKLMSKDSFKNSSSCQECESLKTKLEQANLKHLQLQSSHSSYLQEIHDWKVCMKKANQKIEDLTNKVSLKEDHDQLISDLKNKAQLFEELLRSQSPTKAEPSKVILSKPSNRSHDKSVSTEDLLVNNNSGNSPSFDEKRICDEMARVMAAKVKETETHFKNQLISYEEHIEILTTELNNLKQALCKRDNDILCLKKCILSERAEVKSLMEYNQAEVNEIVQKQHKALEEARQELDVAKKEIDYLKNELNQCEQTFLAEIASINKRETDQYEKSQEMEASYENTIKELTDKYESAKKTAVSYKKYAEDKEKHIERESKRIQNAYDAAVKKIKDNMEKVVKKHEQRAAERIAELEAKLNASKNRSE